MNKLVELFNCIKYIIIIGINIILHHSSMI